MEVARQLWTILCRHPKERAVSIWPSDWESILMPSTPLVEILVRGSLVYLALFALLRFVLKRETGTLGTTDLLVIVLLADAAQNALADDYTSIPDGII